MANKVSGSKKGWLRHIPLILTSEELTLILAILRPASLMILYLTETLSIEQYNQSTELQKKLAGLLG